MKNIRNILLGLLSIVAYTSCDDQLDINPRQLVATSEVLVNEENLTSVLFGAYAGLKGSFGTNEGGELYGGDFNIISEMLGADGNVVWGGSFSTYREVFNKEMTTTNIMVRNNWIRAYDVINATNIVLANLDLAESAESRDNIEGQARAIRGIVYFELIRLWGRPWGTGSEASDLGVPLVVEPVLTVSDADALATIGRSTVQGVYEQALADLNAAKTLLDGLGSNGTSLSTYSVSAMLSRIHLQQGDFASAAEEADRVIASGEYALAPSPLAPFNVAANTGEDVFAIQQTALSNAGTSNGGLATFYARLFGSGRGDIQVQQAFLDSFEEGDLRGGLQDDLSSTATIGSVGEMYYVGVGGQNSGQIQSAKWGDGNLNVQIVRLSEMLLTRAEANFEEGTAVGAAPLTDINTIRVRAGLDPLAAVTLDDIREERQKELAFEGFRIHDLRRWQLPVAGIAFDADELVLPIPERETEVYDIQQNPGY